jgi:hypothetical protein
MTDVELEKLLDALTERVAARILEKIEPASGSGFVTPKQAVDDLPHYPNAAAVRHGIRTGKFKSGTEAIKVGTDWLVNPKAHLARIAKEQTRSKVC